MFTRMFTKDEIAEAIDEERLAAGSYLNGIMDFVKWTSTIDTAAVLWVGSAMTTMSGRAQGLAFCSLSLFIVSLVIAVYAVRQVLTAWAKEWELAREASRIIRNWNPVELLKVNELEKRFGSLSSPEFFTEMTKAGLSYPSANLVGKEMEQLHPLTKAIDAAKPYSLPARYNNWVAWHTVFLVLGLITYVIAQFCDKSF